MALRPEIFISAGTELTAARRAVKLALLEIGAQPVEQLDTTIAYGPLEGVLNQLIGRCEAVIHLAGPRFGLEPAERTLGSVRRSFGQYEVDVARSLGKPIYTFLTGAKCRVDPYPPESDEAQDLQHLHRRALEQSGGVVETFENADELARLIRGLRRRLVVRRRLAALPRAALGDRFVGRRQLMATLLDELAPGKPLVLHPSDEGGLGGMGTTTLALELAWKAYEDRRFDYVFQFPAGPRADVEAAIAALARNAALSLLPNEVESHRIRLEAAYEWFGAEENAGRWLVIFDGVENDVIWLIVRGFLPHFTKGAVLITGRQCTWGEMRTQHLAPLSAEQGREYLSSRLPPRSPASAATDRNVLDQIAEMLGRLPLALELAAGYLRESEVVVADFLAAWLPDPRRPARNWRALSLPDLLERSVGQLDPAARSLLLTLCCLAPEPAAIPLALFEHRSDWAQTRAALALLQRRALIYHVEGGRFLYMHRAVREIIRDRLSPAEISSALGSARATLDAALRRAQSASDGAIVREQIVPHSHGLLGQLNGHPAEEYAGNIVQSLAHWLKDCGRPFEAEPLYRRALAIDERHFKEGVTNLAPRLRDLAAVLRSTGRKDEAELLYRRALDLSEKHYGNEHAEVAADLLNLAGCLRARNCLDEAERLYRRALLIEERQSGRRHPRTAIVLNRLAGVLEIDHRYAEAEAFYRRALKIDEETSGPAHPRIVVLLHNLAGLLLTTRRLSEAESLYRQALEIDEAKFGRDQAEVAPALKGLAFVLEAQRNRAEAEKLYRRVLAIDENAYGPSHSEVGVDLCNLAGILYDQGGLFEEIESLLLRAIEIFSARRIAMRGAHPHLQSALKNYAALLRSKELPEEDVRLILEKVVRPYLVQPRRTTLL